MSYVTTGDSTGYDNLNDLMTSLKDASQVVLNNTFSRTDIHAKYIVSLSTKLKVVFYGKDISDNKQGMLSKKIKKDPKVFSDKIYNNIVERPYGPQNNKTKW